MRSKKVIIAGQNIVINEMKIRHIKEEIIPKIEPALDSLKKSDITQIIDTLKDKAADIFPELNGIDLEDCYPSEIEAFVEAWIDVNFIGVKRILTALLSVVQSFMMTDLPESGSDLVRPLDSQNTGEN